MYVVCWLIMPRGDESPDAPPGAVPPADRFADEVREAGERVVGNLRRSTAEPGRGRMVAGSILIGLGLLFLAEQFLPVWWLNLRHLWPLLLIAGGVVILVQARGGESP
jgi:hypothetical protein